MAKEYLQPVTHQDPIWPDNVRHGAWDMVNEARIETLLESDDQDDPANTILSRVEDRLASQLSPRPRREVWERLETIRRELVLDNPQPVTTEVRARICVELRDIIEGLILQRQLRAMEENGDEMVTTNTDRSAGLGNGGGYLPALARPHGSSGQRLVEQLETELNHEPR